MMQMVRVVLVGCGGMSYRWMEVSKEHPQLELVGFVDMNEEAARARAADYGAGDVAIDTDLQRFLDATRPDAVFDCTVPEAQTQIIVTALQEGYHVLGEKPLADSMENARRSVAAAQAAGKIYAIIQNRRYGPNIRRLARTLRSGAIGPLTARRNRGVVSCRRNPLRFRVADVSRLALRYTQCILQYAFVARLASRAPRRPNSTSYFCDRTIGPCNT